MGELESCSAMQLGFNSVSSSELQELVQQPWVISLA